MDPDQTSVRPHASRLTTLRHLNGLTQGDLARRLDLSQSFLSYVERGQRPFPLDLAHRLSSEFGVPLTFLAVTPSPADITPATFRKTSRASVRDEERVIARYTEACRLFRWASATSGYHTAVLPDPAEHHDDPELLASTIRETAGLFDEDPVPNATRLIERLGIGVIDNLDHRLDETGSAHTGISRPSHLIDRPLIAIVTIDIPPAVKRLTLMHELSHLVLDRDLAGPITSTRSTEEQRAFQLGAAILLPTQAMQRRVSETLNLHGYLTLKADYGVSVAAIIRRAKELRVITPSRYRSLSIQLSAQGWRTHEPVDVADETPILLKQALSRTRPTHPLEYASRTLGVLQNDIRHWTHATDNIADHNAGNDGPAPSYTANCNASTQEPPAGAVIDLAARRGTR